MNLDYLLFLSALLSLWTPAALFAPRAVRAQLRGPARRRRKGLRSLVRAKLNWFDGVRAALGTWLLLHQVQFLQAGPDADEIKYFLLGAQLAALFIGTLVQTLWFSEETRVIGPLFFLAGIAVMLLPPAAGIPAVVLGVNCALLLRRLRLAFLFTPVALAALGVVFGAPIHGVFGALLFTLPGFLAFALDRNPVYLQRGQPAAARRLLAWPTGRSGNTSEFPTSDVVAEPLSTPRAA